MNDIATSRRAPVAPPLSLSAMLLIGSLCVNVALGAFVAAQLFKAGPSRAAQMNPQRLVALLEQRLPPDDAAHLREVYQAKESDLAAARAAHQRARFHTLSLLAAPELDKEALRTAIADTRVQRQRIGDILTDIIETTFERMNPQTRRNLVLRFRIE